MNKIKWILGIIGGMVICYIILTVSMDPIREIIGEGAVVVNANPNIADYEGVSDFYAYAPWLLYLIPTVAGGYLIVKVLKSDSV